MSGGQVEFQWDFGSRSWEQRVLEKKWGRKGSQGGDTGRTEVGRVGGSGSSGNNSGGDGGPSAHSTAPPCCEQMQKEEVTSSEVQGDGGTDAEGPLRVAAVTGEADDGEWGRKGLRGVGDEITGSEAEWGRKGTTCKMAIRIDEVGRLARFGEEVTGVIHWLCRQQGEKDYYREPGSCGSGAEVKEDDQGRRRRTRVRMRGGQIRQYGGCRRLRSYGRLWWGAALQRRRAAALNQIRNLGVNTRRELRR